MPHETFPTTTESVPQFHPISNGKLGVFILLGAELMFFATLIGAFLVFRLGSVTWPPPSQMDIRLPRAVTGVTA